MFSHAPLFISDEKEKSEESWRMSAEKSFLWTLSVLVSQGKWLWWCGDCGSSGEGDGSGGDTVLLLLKI